MEYISSSHNPTFKTWVKLTQSRQARARIKKTLIDGIHLVSAAQDQKFPLQQLIVAESFCHSLAFQTVKQKDSTQIICLSDKLFSLLSSMPSPTGLMAVVDIPQPMPINKTGLVLALEGIQDPGNIGTILRTAVACGVNQVWLDKKCADIWSPKVLRAGMGAHFAINCVWGINLVEALEDFQGKIFATALDETSTPLYHVNLSGDTLLIFGNEGGGISPTIRQQANEKIAIPMQRGIESLNVATAVAVCLYERYRQTFYHSPSIKYDQ